jgi:hypothetical protein
MKRTIIIAALVSFLAFATFSSGDFYLAPDIDLEFQINPDIFKPPCDCIMGSGPVSCVTGDGCPGLKSCNSSACIANGDCGDCSAYRSCVDSCGSNIGCIIACGPTGCECDGLWGPCERVDPCCGIQCWPGYACDAGECICIDDAICGPEGDLPEADIPEAGDQDDADEEEPEGLNDSESDSQGDSAGDELPDGETEGDLDGDSANIETADSGPLFGSDRDAHGCIPSAGYVWCDSLSMCIRPWETACPPHSDVPSPGESQAPQLDPNMIIILVIIIVLVIGLLAALMIAKRKG